MRRICNENRCKYSENRRTNQIIIEKYLISNEKSGNEISLYGDEGHTKITKGFYNHGLSGLNGFSSSNWLRRAKGSSNSLNSLSKKICLIRSIRGYKISGVFWSFLGGVFPQCVLLHQYLLSSMQIHTLGGRFAVESAAVERVPPFSLLRGFCGFRVRYTRCLSALAVEVQEELADVGF